MHTIGFVVFPNFHLLGFAAVSAFETANRLLDEPSYEVTLLSETGGLVPASAGFRVETQPFGDTVFDTVVLGSGIETDITSPALVAFVRQAAATSRRVAAPCTGAFILAEAGVLDGRRATTHWRFARDLQRRFPKVTVQQDQIFVVDGSIWTSAGMAATIDLALAMIEKDHGKDVSRTARASLSSTTGGRRASPRFPRCSSSSLGRTGSRRSSTTRARTCATRCPSRSSPRSLGSARASSAGPSARRPASRRRGPSNSCASKRRG